MSKVRRYGKWAGNPNGYAEDLSRCAQEVWPQGGWFSAQCQRKRGHGLDGLYCKQHAKRYPAQPIGEES